MSGCISNVRARNQGRQISGSQKCLVRQWKQLVADTFSQCRLLCPEPGQREAYAVTGGHGLGCYADEEVVLAAVGTRCAERLRGAAGWRSAWTLGSAHLQSQLRGHALGAISKVFSVGVQPSKAAPCARSCL